MTDHGEQLRETFETHETLAPDPAAVYARVQELSRTYKRRRRGAQAAGTAALGAGLIAGAIQLPSMLSGPSGGAGVAAPASAVPSVPASAVPSVAPSYSQAELDRAWAAYFAAGYGYEDAVRLAAVWRTDKNIGLVKAEAGRRLLAGETLPIRPHPDPSVPAVPDADPASAALQAFFDAGYVYDDAVRLAQLWKLPDPSDAKVAAGRKLQAGEELPIKPKAANLTAARESAAIDKFFAAGYDHHDALELARLWHLKDAHSAKVAGGEKLLAGQTLPIRP